MNTGSLHRLRYVLLLACARLAHFGGAGEAGLQQAYIGPGAGIALLGSFFAVFSGFLSAVFFAVTYPIRLIWRTLRSGPLGWLRGLRSAQPGARVYVSLILRGGYSGERHLP